MPRVSVIMPAYNGAATISESIESVLAQTYTDWELIICDDCSTDGTYDIARAYAEKHSNISVIKSERNSGPGAARNRCIERATGEYLAVMDCDDLSDPARFAKQVDLLDAHPEYAIAGVWGEMFDKDGVWCTLQYPKRPKKNKIAFHARFLYCATLMRRDAVHRVGGYREGTDYIVGEDHDLVVRLYAAGYIGYNIPEILLRYRFDRSCNYKITVSKRMMMFKNHRRCVRALGLPLWYRIVPYKQLLAAIIPLRLMKLYWAAHLRISERRAARRAQCESSPSK